MNIVFLGHRDIASLVAMTRVIRGAPEDRFTVFLSGAMKEHVEVPEELRQLAAHDEALCQQYLQGPNVPREIHVAKDLAAPNRADGLARLRAGNPDLVVSIRYRRILKDAAIAIPTNGVINLHSGILPDYRGVMATFWAMLNKEAEIGSTLHRITDAGIDTGPVIAISRQLLQPKRSYLDNVLSLYETGCATILAAVDTIRQGGEPETTIQSTRAGTYFSTPGRDDIKKFLAMGLKLSVGPDA